MIETSPLYINPAIQLIICWFSINHRPFLTFFCWSQVHIKKNHDLNLIATTNFSPNYFKLPIWYTMMKRIFIILFLTYVVIFANNALFHLSMLHHSPRCFGWCRGCLIGFVGAFGLHLIFMWFTLWWFYDTFGIVGLTHLGVFLVARYLWYHVISTYLYCCHVRKQDKPSRFKTSEVHRGKDIIWVTKIRYYVKYKMCHHTIGR